MGGRWGEGEEEKRTRADHRVRFVFFCACREEEIVQSSFEKVNNVASQATAELGMPCTSSRSSLSPHSFSKLTSLVR